MKLNPLDTRIYPRIDKNVSFFNKSVLNGLMLFYNETGGNYILIIIENRNFNLFQTKPWDAYGKP